MTTGLCLRYNARREDIMGPRHFIAIVGLALAALAWAGGVLGTQY